MRQPQNSASASPSASSESGGTLYLVLIQVTSRGLTFLGNQFLLRYLPLTLLGLAVQLELLSVTVLYFARESLRVTVQRQPVSEVEKTPASHDKAGKRRILSQEIVNLAYLVLLVGLAASVVFGYSYLQRSSSEVTESANFLPAFQLYAAATLIELLAEPCFVVIQHHSLYKGRARAETAAAISRCLTACLATVVTHQYRLSISVLPFAIGQLAYAVTLFTVYLITVLPVARAGQFSLLPRRVIEGNVARECSNYWFNLFSKPLLSLTSTFYAQSLFKLFLTHGDSLILSLLADLKSQGAFALASNYGGLLSRLIFQPVEESSRNVFGRLLGSAANNGQVSQSKSKSESESEKKKPSTAPDRKNMTTLVLEQQYESNNHDKSKESDNSDPSNTQLGLSHLATTLHIYVLFSLPVLALVPTILPAAIGLVFSPQLRTFETISLLQAYVWYLPFLAVNGVLDAFVTSVATPSQLASQSLIMTSITVAYGLFSWILMASSETAERIRAVLILNSCTNNAPLRSVGLVYANIFNMSLRIIYSIWFIKNWIDEKHTGRDSPPTKTSTQTFKDIWKRSLPSLSCILIAAIAAVGLPRLTALDTAEVSTPKNLMGINGISLEDLAYVLSTAIVLGTSILATEYQFLLDILLPLIPTRLSSKIQPYLVKKESGKI